MTSERRGWAAMLALGAATVLHDPRAAHPATGSPFDFTGHWTGVAQETGGRQETLTGDLVTVTTKTFTGTFAAEGDVVGQCTVKGREKRSLKVKLRFSCEGTTIKAHGILDPSSPTVTGAFTRNGRHKVHHGTFTLTRQAT